MTQDNNKVSWTKNGLLANSFRKYSKLNKLCLSNKIYYRLESRVLLLLSKIANMVVFPHKIRTRDMYTSYLLTAVLSKLHATKSKYICCECSGCWWFVYVDFNIFCYIEKECCKFMTVPRVKWWLLGDAQLLYKFTSHKTVVIRYQLACLAIQGGPIFTHSDSENLWSALQ